MDPRRAQYLNWSVWLSWILKTKPNGKWPICGEVMGNTITVFLRGCILTGTFTSMFLGSENDGTRLRSWHGLRPLMAIFLLCIANRKRLYIPSTSQVVFVQPLKSSSPHLISMGADSSKKMILVWTVLKTICVRLYYFCSHGYGPVRTWFIWYHALVCGSARHAHRRTVSHFSVQFVFCVCIVCLLPWRCSEPCPM